LCSHKSIEKYSAIIFHNYIEFSESEFDVGAFIAFSEHQDRYIGLQENTLANITNNNYRPLTAMSNK